MGSCQQKNKKNNVPNNGTKVIGNSIDVRKPIKEMRKTIDF